MSISLDEFRQKAKESHPTRRPRRKVIDLSKESDAYRNPEKKFDPDNFQAKKVEALKARSEKLINKTDQLIRKAQDIETRIATNSETKTVTKKARRPVIEVPDEVKAGLGSLHPQDLKLLKIIMKDTKIVGENRITTYLNKELYGLLKTSPATVKNSIGRLRQTELITIESINPITNKPSRKFRTIKIQSSTYEQIKAII